MSGPWFLPRGALARDRWDVVVDDDLDGWSYTGLRVADLGGEPRVIPSDDRERMVVPLTGRTTVRWRSAGGETGEIHLAGRPSVFHGPADAASFGPATELAIEGEGRVAVAEAAARIPRPPAVLRAPDVPVELRGAGRSSRQVQNFGVPGALPAERLIVCEVITPAGNWSSYPPHKHDEATATETRLEEIYYFETAVERGAEAPGSDPIGVFAGYGSPAGELDLVGIVHTGDVALVPHGYHGPAGALPGYDLYYLNVMAGPDPERAWKISDDPRHGWVRGTWEHELPDPRLPYGPEEGRVR